MPRLTSFKIDAIADLFHQLRYAPVATRLRELENLEHLVEEIDHAQPYPEDFIVFRITGYRSDAASVGEPVPGEMLVGELTSFIERLSHGLELPHDWSDRTAVAMDEVQRRLNVSRKTLQRYRRDGLVCHYVVFPGQGRRLACFEDSLSRFTARHHERLERAAAFTRVSDEHEQVILQEAREMHEHRGAGLTATSAMLARKHGRAVETMRQLLRRHDRESPTPIFTRPGPLTARNVRLVTRATRRGIAASAIAERLGKSPATIHRAILRGRAKSLRRVDLTGIVLPTFELDDADDIILKSPIVTSDLIPWTWPPDDALAILDEMKRSALDEHVEDAMIAAFHFLVWKARCGIETLPRWPSASALDDIETSLRWASRLHRCLLRASLPQALQTIERGFHRHLGAEPAEIVEEMIRLAIDVVTATVRTVDPSRGQRLQRLVVQHTDRVLATQGITGTSDRAAARHAAESIPIRHCFARVLPWDEVVDLRPDWLNRLQGLDADDRSIVERHHGLVGQRPRSCAELATEQGVTISVISRRLATTMDALRRGIDTTR